MWDFKLNFLLHFSKVSQPPNRDCISKEKKWRNVPDDEELRDLIDVGATEAYEIIGREVVWDSDNEEESGSRGSAWQGGGEWEAAEEMDHASALAQVRVRVWGDGERMVVVHWVDSEGEHGARVESRQTPLRQNEVLKRPRRFLSRHPGNGGL